MFAKKEKGLQHKYYKIKMYKAQWWNMFVCLFGINVNKIAIFSLLICPTTFLNIWKITTVHYKLKMKVKSY